LKAPSKMYVKNKIPSVEDIFRAQKLMDKAAVRKTLYQNQIHFQQSQEQISS